MKFHIITLGCKVNAYESQYYAQKFEEKGWQEDNKDFDVCIINTCTVTNTAASKSRQMIHKEKKRRPDAIFVVVGCYAQTATEEAKKELDVDLIIGAKYKKDLVNLVEDFVQGHQRKDMIVNVDDYFEFESMPIQCFESKHRAFLKVQDGCNQFCSYCQIPFARGRERSLNHKEAVTIAQDLEKRGHIEIVLTGIHTGRYYDGEYNLTMLLKDLLENTSEEVCYRISSIEITEVTKPLIELMKENPRVLPHLHIPIQAGCDATLKRMNRPYTMKQFMDRIDWIRHEIPHVSISTDIIAGFVQESDEEFETTFENLKKIHFSFLHVFPFSVRSGTAAANMKGFVHGTVVKNRVARLIALSDELRNEDMKRFKEVTVLIERRQNDCLIGYTNQYHLAHIETDEDLSGRQVFTWDSIQDETYQIRKKDLNASI